MLRIIAGTARGRRFEAPEGRDTRPTLDRVRENLFNMLQNRVRDARVLDLFAVSGALSLEALSRGAAAAVLTDISARAHRVEKKNVETLGFGDRALEILGFQDRARQIRSPWERTLRTLKGEGEKFDLIFLDPPYAMTDLRELTEELIPLMAEDAWVVLEHQAGAEIQVSERLGIVKERAWGYCGVKIYEQLRDSGIL